MHRLCLLGRVDLVDQQGTELRSVLAQPRRLAVLAYLAIRGNTPSRRDQLLGVFWPELNQDRARKALNKSLHFLRQTLGEETIVSRGADEVLVDASRLWCDVVAFRAASNAGDASQALELYRGDLLPAFYIEEAIEFERWLDQERLALRREAGRAASQLAELRDREGQSTMAIGLARRAVELLDEDERVVRQLLELLDRLGDRAGALYAYDKFARRLAAEFGADPASETRALIERIRSRGESGGSATTTRDVEARPTVVGQSSGSVAVGLGASGHDKQRVVAPGPRAKVAVAAASLLALGAVAIGFAVFGQPPVSAQDQPVIAVMPFRVAGPSNTNDYLREGAIDIANALLTGDGIPRSIDTRTLLAAARGIRAGAEVSQQDLLVVAERLGASHALLGEVVGNAEAATATARVLRLHDKKIVAQASEEFGPGSEIMGIKRLIGRVAAVMTGDDAMRVSQFSDSTEAVRSYLAGMQLLRNAKPALALAQFNRALAIDTAFAVAALWRTFVYDAAVTGAEAMDSVTWSLRHALSVRDQAIVNSLWSIGPKYPEPASSGELVAAAERAAQLNRDRAEVWVRLAHVLCDFGAISSVDNWTERAAWAADRAVALDSHSVNALRARRRVALLQRDQSAERHLRALLRARGDASVDTTLYEWWSPANIQHLTASFTFSPNVSRMVSHRVRGGMPGSVFAKAASEFGLSLDDLEPVMRAEHQRVRDPQLRASMTFALFSMAMYRGNVGRAQTWAAIAAPPQHGPLFDGVYNAYAVAPAELITVALLESGFDSIATQAAKVLTVMADTASHPQQIANATCFAELWRATHGDTSNTRRAIRRIRQSTALLPPIAIYRVGRLDVCSQLLEAQLEASGGWFGHSALDRLDSLMQRGTGVELPGHVANIMIARWRMEQGNVRGALAAIQRRAHVSGRIYALTGPAYFREHGRIAALAGDTMAAIEAYTRYLTLRDDPDARPLRDEVQGVRAHLERLRPRDNVGRPQRSAVGSLSGKDRSWSSLKSSIASKFVRTTYVPNRVLIVPLESAGGDAALDAVASEILARLPVAIAREGVGEPVPASVVRDLFGNATGSPEDIANSASRSTGAGIQLRGACSRTAGAPMCQVDVFLMPARSLRFSIAVSGDPTSSSFVNELEERLLVALFLQHTWGDDVDWLGEYVPRSLAAVRAFKRACCDGREQTSYYGEAARLDTGWAAAAAWAAWDSSESAARSVFARLSRQRGMIEGELQTVAASSMDFDMQRAQQFVEPRHSDGDALFQLVRRRFEVNPEWWVMRATWLAAGTGRSATAVAISAYVDSALAPKGERLLVYEHRSAALHHLGRFREQLQLAHTLERLFPGEVTARRAIESAALAGLGEVETLRRSLAGWEATPEPRSTALGPTSGTRAYIAGLELIAHDRPREGLEVLASSVPVYRRLRETEGYRPEFLNALILTNQLAEARDVAVAELVRARSGADSVALLAYLGAIADRQGQQVEAAQHFARAGRFDSRIDRGGRSIARMLRDRATRAGWMGDRQGVVRALEEARTYQPWLVSHHHTHREPAFIKMRDYPPLLRFLDPRQ